MESIEHFPAPFRVTFETNPNDCNLRCIMCETHSIFNTSKHKGRYMDPAIIRLVFSELRGTCFSEIVTTPMGEPLLYKHFNEMIDLCENHKIKLHITTNGTFPKNGIDLLAEKLCRIGADIKISINGITKSTLESIMPGADFELIKKNILVLGNARKNHEKSGEPKSRLTLKTTFMNLNIRELPEMVDFAYKFGFDRIRGSHIFSIFSETKNQELLQNPELQLVFNKMIAEAKQKSAELSKVYGRSIELSNFELSGDDYSYGKCPYLGVEAFIDVDGNLVSCCVPEKARPKNGSFGNLNRNKLLEIWNGKTYRDFCNDYTNFLECKVCSKRMISKN